MEREVRKEMGQNCSTRPAANFSGFFPIEELGKERKKREKRKTEKKRKREVRL